MRRLDERERAARQAIIDAITGIERKPEPTTEPLAPAPDDDEPTQRIPETAMGQNDAGTQEDEPGKGHAWPWKTIGGPSPATLRRITAMLLAAAVAGGIGWVGVSAYDRHRLSRTAAECTQEKTSAERNRAGLDKATRAVTASRDAKTLADGRRLYNGSAGKVADEDTRKDLRKALDRKDAQAVRKAMDGVDASRQAKSQADQQAQQQAQAQAAEQQAQSRQQAEAPAQAPRQAMPEPAPQPQPMPAQPPRQTAPAPSAGDWSVPSAANGGDQGFPDHM